MDTARSFTAREDGETVTAEAVLALMAEGANLPAALRLIEKEPHALGAETVIRALLDLGPVGKTALLGLVRDREHHRLKSSGRLSAELSERILQDEQLRHAFDTFENGDTGGGLSYLDQVTCDRYSLHHRINYACDVLSRAGDIADTDEGATESSNLVRELATGKYPIDLEAHGLTPRFVLRVILSNGSKIAMLTARQFLRHNRGFLRNLDVPTNRLLVQCGLRREVDAVNHTLPPVLSAEVRSMPPVKRAEEVDTSGIQSQRDEVVRTLQLIRDLPLDNQDTDYASRISSSMANSSGISRDGVIQLLLLHHSAAAGEVLEKLLRDPSAPLKGIGEKGTEALIRAGLWESSMAGLVDWENWGGNRARIQEILAMTSASAQQ